MRLHDMITERIYLACSGGQGADASVTAAQRVPAIRPQRVLLIRPAPIFRKTKTPRMTKSVKTNKNRTKEHNEKKPREENQATCCMHVGKRCDECGVFW